MGFQFRYERLLNYRRHLKDRAEIEFAASVDRLNLAREALGALKADREKTDASFRVGLATSLEASEIQNYADYLGLLKERMSLQAREIERLEAMVSKNRGLLLEKARDVKVIEMLKERDLRKWQGHQEEVEQKRLNEVGIVRHRREFA